MKAKRVLEATPKTYVVVFSAGDEAIEGLQGFARSEGLSAASLKGIGAFADARLGFFDWEAKRYEPVVVSEQVEVLSLIGDVALGEDGVPQLHAHFVLGCRDGRAVGGHLLAATVRPTLEIVLTEAPAQLRKRGDPETGLALIDLGR
ncbi:MAG: DUF296 domain-containing protein [Solirubrobacterales bacterium]|nr:DUF296 domain-containing protein [Solirubrobacterales bacterium]